VAFSNGVEATLCKLLRKAEILPHLGGIVSVDGLGTFKPDPRVYFHLVKSVHCAAGQTWIVSSNPFDVIGAKSAGLRAAWIKRKSESVFDPWNITPDLIARDLTDFCEQLGKWL
jgi:2-haloacid dehalogenase